MSNLQWYEKFNTKVDVGSAISVTQQHKVLLEYVAQENHILAFTALSAKQKQVVHEAAEEHTSHAPSYIRAEPNMIFSRWI
jgi:threonine synthase